MAGVVTAVALFVFLALAPTFLLAALGSGAPGWRALPPARWLLKRRPEPEPAPPVRPIEQVASDVRRISQRYHQQGMRFVQYEGRRRAYDGVLGEAADMLGIAHLLGVLPPGAELDRERSRVERLLAEAGVLPDAA
jgi:hypothetical protein